MIPDDFGLLHLQAQMPETIQVPARWIDDSGISIALAIAVFLYLAGLPLFFRLVPDLVKSVFKQHGPVAFEHSIQKSRSRTFLCAILLPLNVLIIDRLGLYCPSRTETLPHWWQLAVILAALLAFFLLRLAMISTFKHRNLHGDNFLAVKFNILSVWVFLSYLLAPFLFILLRLGLPETSIATAILYVSAAFFALSCLRSFQLMKNPCGLFLTFLYLCAFEFAPAALFVLSAKAL